MKAITDVTTSELVVTLSFFQIGGYATNTQLSTAVSGLQTQIDALKERTKAVEDDLNSRTFA